MTNDNEPRTVLVIDDEPHVVAYLEMLLQDAGYRTISAANGRTGFERVLEERPDLVCLDITMPEESGIRFYKKLREKPEVAQIPMVVVAACYHIGCGNSILSSDIYRRVYSG